MSIIRSLLVSIGFKVNRNQQTQTNRAISNVNFNLLALGGSLSIVAGKAVQLFNDLAKGTLNARDLSQALGVSLEDILAMQRAAQDFRINESQFQGALNIVNALFQDFRNGGRALRELARELKINIDPNGNALTVLNQIIASLGQVENEQNRINSFGKLFGKDLAVSFSNLSQNFDKYLKSVESFRNVAATQANSVPTLEAYERGINNINQSYRDLQLTLSTFVLPGIAELLDSFKIYFNLLNGIITGIKSFFSSGSFIDRVKRVGSSIYNSLPSANPNSAIINSFKSTPSAPTVNNEINITVPYGTNEEQAEYISQGVKNSVDASVLDAFMQIQNNYPLVEY